MDDEVGANRKGLLQRGRQESVVDGHLRAGRVSPRRDGANVNDAHQGIAWRFDQHQGRAATQRRAEHFLVALIDECDIELAAIASGISRRYVPP